MKPGLYLDVDGVLNVFGAPAERVRTVELTESVSVPSRRGKRKRTIFRETVDVPNGMLERVARLLKAFDPVWVSQWGPAAHEAFREVLELEGGPWPVVGYHRLKLPAIARHAEGTRWAWVDDGGDTELEEVMRHPRLYDVDLSESLIVTTRVSEGLTDEHVERLLEWAK